MPPPLSPQAFVTKWRSSSLRENAAYAEHFIDLCRLVDHPTPAEVDSEGSTFAFQAGVKKTGGKQGWADVYKRGHFGWEYKGKHADLDKAYAQLLQYRESLENPPLLVVSDMERIVIHTNFTNTAKQVVTLTLEDLLTLAGFKQLRAIFYEPETFKAPQTTAQVTEAAAKEFARLAESLRKWGEEPHRAAHFLIRLLFCLFAEDVGLLPSGLFSRLLERTRTRSSAFAQQLQQLFAAMATGGWFGAEEIPHFNGKLFDDATVLEMDSDALNILARVSTLDWSSIEPSIFGTLFERSLDPAKRSQLGAHYTSRDDILLIVEPVLMAPLRRKWAEVQTRARELATKRDAATGGQRTRLDNELRGLLTGFAQEIAGVQVLDPACGSANFLYVALKQLLDLEKEVIRFAGDIGVGTFFPSVSPEQLHGIEVNEYAHELAQVTVWIGYIQWLRDNGFGVPSQPILKPLDTIKRMDAILAFDNQGRPYEPEWPQADVIVGNPPFLGDRKMRGELSDQYVDALRTHYEGRVPAGADLVTYWFERSRALIERRSVERVGLLATNSITGGMSRRVLDRVTATGTIFMAWNDRPWVLDGAAVRVAMVGFDSGKELSKSLNGHPVTQITSNLSGTLDAAQAQRLNENHRLCFLGVMKAGAFDIDADTAVRMLTAPLNPNGRPNSDVIKPRINGQDITRRPGGSWLIDFGVSTTEEDASLYEQPFEYIRAHVKPLRETNRRPRFKTYWWLHGESRPGMRNSIASLKRFIATPTLSKYRLFVWLQHPTLPDHQTLVFAREDDYFFGVLQSSQHEVWALRMGTSLEDRPRYTPSSVFETFPLPWPPGKEPQGDPRVAAIAEAARRLVELRDRWLNPPDADEATLKKRTLTNLYNERPAWLDNAHQKLNKAVFDAYGWPYDLGDEEILARLLALNLERAAKQGSFGTALREDMSEDDE